MSRFGKGFEHPGSNLNVVDASGLGRFTTAVLFRGPHGEQRVWGSRRNRKGLDSEPAHLVARSRPRHLFPIELGSLTWWIAVLFMIGSTLFAVGSASALYGHGLAAQSGLVFFAGSIFFTSAGYLQFLEVINEPDALTKTRPPTSFWRWEPHKLGWWAVLVQLVGTLLFNMNTFEATQHLSSLDQDRLVWVPDALGSICFLVASYLAYGEVCNDWMDWQPRNVSWWIVVINLLGSVAFGVSAVASFVLVQSGELVSAYDSNLGTFAGAICFFVGAYLLLPEMTSHSEPHASSG